MKKGMILITAILLVGFLIALPVFALTKSSTAETVAITIGITLYHFAMRLAVGAAINAIMKNKADYKNAWFREKSFEKRLYKLIRVRKWSKHLPTYSKETFDTSRRTVNEILGATCQAEVVHEVIMVLSLLPIITIPFLGGASVMIITSVFAMLFDSMFVILQRYNRPRLVRVMERFQRLNSQNP